MEYKELCREFEMLTGRPYHDEEESESEITTESEMSTESEMMEDEDEEQSVKDVSRKNIKFQFVYELDVNNLFVHS